VSLGKETVTAELEISEQVRKEQIEESDAGASDVEGLEPAAEAPGAWSGSLNSNSKKEKLMTTQTNPPHAQSAGVTNGEKSDPEARAQDVAGQAQEKAQAVVGQVQNTLREQLAARSSRVAGQINEQASDLRSVGESLREQGKQAPARAAERLAEYAEKVGGYLGEKDPDGLLRDAEEFGRRQPAALAAGGILVGFAASRFLKASSRRRHAAQSARPSGPPASTAPRQSSASDVVAAEGTPVPGIVTPVPGAAPPVYASHPSMPGSVPPVDRGIQQ
jgi:hypothetical protein